MSSPLKQYFIRLLQKQDYSYQTLLSKAQAKGYERADITETLKWLEHHQLVDDSRLAKQIIQTYAGTKGPQWIQQKLQQKQIPEPIIEDLHIPNQPNNKFWSKLETRYKIHLADFFDLEFKLQQKILAYMSRQGFVGVKELLQREVQRRVGE